MLGLICASCEYSRLVFDAGLTGGAADDGSWTAQFALSDPEYQAGLNLDKRFLECATPLKDEMYPAKAGSKKSISQDAFEEKFVSRFKAGDPEKGYAPTVKAFVEHRDFDKDGKPLRKCKVYKAELEEDGDHNQAGSGRRLRPQGGGRRRRKVRPVPWLVHHAKVHGRQVDPRERDRDHQQVRDQRVDAQPRPRQRQGRTGGRAPR